MAPNSNFLKPTVKVDTTVSTELRDLQFVGHFDDATPLVAFIQRDGLPRSLTFLKHKYASREHVLFVRNLKFFLHALQVINFSLNDQNPQPHQIESRLRLLEERERISQFYLDFCSDLSLAYHVFSDRKPAAVAEMTSIFTAVVEFRNPQVFNEFLSRLDLSNSAIQKLFIPTKDDFQRKIIADVSMRSVFIEFWICLCSNVNAELRLKFFTNYKLVVNFWKYLEMDRFEVLANVFDFLLKLVINEKSFKRADRTRILNESFIYGVRPLFDYIKAKNDRDQDNDDVDDFNRFKNSFNEFMEILVIDQEKGISFPENEFGTPLVVNNVTFKINNRLIYVLLTILKPWENYSQLQLVMKILNNNNELLPPYMHWIVSSSGGYHDPSLTSYWIGHTLLYTEILKLPMIPSKTNFIALFPLSGTILTSILAYPSVLVQQLGLQLILLQLKKLSTPGVSQAVIESVTSALPLHISFIPFLLHENRFLKVTATQILTQWENVAPGLSSSAIINAITRKVSEFDFSSSLSAIDLVLLDNYLSIQSNSDLKWWNKTGKDNSFFTSLLKLSHLPGLGVKILKILQNLLNTSLAFNHDHTIEDPLVVLLEMVAVPISQNASTKLFNCIDETIARTIKTPYKYLDKSTESYDKLSVFVVALFEQVKFIPNFEQEKEIHNWIEMFAKGLAIIGEPLEGIKKAAQDQTLKITVDSETVNLPPKISNKIQFAEAIMFFNRYSESGEDANLYEAATKMYQFLNSESTEDTMLLKFVTNPLTWKCLSSLNSSSYSKNQKVACALLNELLRLWVPWHQENKLGKLIYDIGFNEPQPEVQYILKDFLYLLSNEQILLLAEKYSNEILVLNALKEAIDRKLSVSANYKELVHIDSPEVDTIIEALPPSMDELNYVLHNAKFSYFFNDPSEATIAFLLSKDDLEDSVLYYVAPSSREISKKYQKRVVALAESLKNWPLSLEIFAANYDMFDKDKMVKIVSEYITGKPKDAMTSEFVKFVSILFEHTSSLAEFGSWINRAMLYVTKKLAECKTLSYKFDSFVVALGDFFVSHNRTLQAVSVDIVNAQLQVLFSHTSWVSKEKYLSYANKLLLAEKSGKFDSTKLIQLFVTNPKMVLQKLPLPDNGGVRFEAALVIYTLFKMDPAASSTQSLLQSIIALYQGSARAEDLLLKSVLVALEEQLSESWVALVTSWTFSGELNYGDAELVGTERLFIKKDGTFEVALRKNFVTNTMNNIPKIAQLPKTKSYVDYQNFLSKCRYPSYWDTTYDPEFLLLVIVSNDELFLFTGGNFNVSVQELMGSNLLAFIVSALSDTKMRSISKVILHGILKFLQTLEEEFKDSNIYKIYISSILHTLRVEDHLMPLVWYMVGSFAPILADPSHHLYDLVCQYVLSHPLYKQYVIPLFSLISTGAFGNSEVEGDAYYKQIDWMLEELSNGISSADDIRLLSYRHVMDWALNLMNCKYTSPKLRSKVLNLVYAIQGVGAEGIDMLVTRSAALSSLATLKQTIGNGVFADEQLRLNIDQIALRFGVVSSQKRLAEWAQGDVAQAAKRIHLA